MSEIRKIVVVGAGSWGTALAMVLSEGDVEVSLWSPREEATRVLATTRHSPLLGDDTPPLADNITPTSDLSCVREADLILVVVPSLAMRSVAKTLSAIGVARHACVLSCSKGIEKGSHLRMTEILGQYLPGTPIGALSGPNHAEDICLGLPSATSVGFRDAQYAATVQKNLTRSKFRVYTSTDPIGMQLGGSIKNVFALASGMCAGLHLGDNAQAALVTRSLAEMTRLGVVAGGRRETFMGLSGVGDLMVTCYSMHSRNFRVGYRIGGGEDWRDVVKDIGMVAEGVPNTISIREMAQKLGVRSPLVDAVYDVLYEGRSPLDMLSELMSRDPRPEQD